MKPQTPFQRFLLGAAAALVVLIAGFLWVGAAIPNWGATQAEVNSALPGDAQVPAPDLVWNHAITVRAPAEQVYPWLVQIGDSRAAFYSITFIENLFCAMSGECRYTNANQVRAEWQNPAKGQQGIIMDYMVIEDYQPGQWVLAGPTEKLPLQWTWLWHVQPVDAATSRLVVRHRIAFPADAPKAMIDLVFNAGYVMERAMLLGIRARAEGSPPWAGAEAAGAAIWLLVFGMGVAGAVRFVRAADGYHALGVGIEAIIALFVLTFIQPPVLVRLLLTLMVAAGLWVAYRRADARRRLAALRKARPAPDVAPSA